MVEKKTWPPGRTSRAQAATMLCGSGTCSRSSMQVTTSNSAACVAAYASAMTCS